MNWLILDEGDSWLSIESVIREGELLVILTLMTEQEQQTYDIDALFAVQGVDSIRKGRDVNLLCKFYKFE